MTKIFAYGSLVNTKTWSFDTEYDKATLSGWVRQWKMITEINKEKLCALTIIPKKKSSIDGIFIKTDSFIQNEIDKRERGYKKIVIGKENFNKKIITPSRDYKVVSYLSNDSTCNWASDNAPIMQSYIDVVADGFYQVFKEEGFEKFFESTEGWHLPIINDRSHPKYPRSLNLDTNFLKKIDNQIQKILEKNG